MGRVIGVDAGSVRVGVALSDDLGITARPLTTIRRKDDRSAAEAIRLLAVAHDASRIVVGIPIGLDGGDQKTTHAARRLAEAIREATALPVIGWDERLTTAQAERSLIEGNVRRERRREIVDQVAAALMLQSFLDAEAARGPSSGGAGPGSRAT
jgi:putative Holliday junction resolvase